MLLVKEDREAWTDSVGETMRMAGATLVGLAAALVAGCGGGVRNSPTALPVVTAPGINPPNSSPALTSRDELGNRARWTILVFLNADNDLETYGISNFNQMEMIGSTRDVHVLVQIDRVPGHDQSNGDWTDTRRYMVTRDSNSSTISSVRLDSPELGELNMGDYRTLRDFVEWGVRESPSDNYCLVIWDHGTGWQFRLQAQRETKYISVDDTSFSAINVTELANALGGLNVAVVAFDACLMQQIEVAYEMKDSAGYMVAAASSEPSPGYNYYAWISRVTASTSARELSRIICEEYVAAYPLPRKGIQQSAVDLSKIEELAAAASGFALLLKQSTAYRPALESARRQTLNFSTADGGANRDYLDLLHYASLAAAAIGQPAQSAYARLDNAARAAVVVDIRNADMTNSRGIGIYIPAPGFYSGAYASLRFAADTAWDEWIRGS